MAVFRQRGMACTDGNLKVDKLIRDGAHLVVEAERVVTDIVAREDEVSLSLLLPIYNDLARGACDLEVNIERTSRLDLKPQLATLSYVARRRSAK